MYVTTVLVSPFSLDTVWKAHSPLTPITFYDLGTSCKPLSPMFQMLLGRNSIFHFLTHCTKSSKNFSIWTGFVPIACATEIFWEFFLRRLGFLFKNPCNHFRPAVFLVGENLFSLFYLLIHKLTGRVCHLRREILSLHNTSQDLQVDLLGLSKMYEIKGLHGHKSQPGHQYKVPKQWPAWWPAWWPSWSSVTVTVMVTVMVKLTRLLTVREYPGLSLFTCNMPFPYSSAWEPLYHSSFRKTQLLCYGPHAQLFLWRLPFICCPQHLSLFNFLFLPPLILLVLITHGISLLLGGFVDLPPCPFLRIFAS